LKKLISAAQGVSGASESDGTDQAPPGLPPIEHEQPDLPSYSTATRDLLRQTAILEQCVVVRLEADSDLWIDTVGRNRVAGWDQKAKVGRSRHPVQELSRSLPLFCADMRFVQWRPNLEFKICRVSMVNDAGGSAN
jgi:hypothetical protein